MEADQLRARVAELERENAALRGALRWLHDSINDVSGLKSLNFRGQVATTRVRFGEIVRLDNACEGAKAALAAQTKAGAT
jgi:hypothetical protein